MLHRCRVMKYLRTYLFMPAQESPIRKTKWGRASNGSAWERAAPFQALFANSRVPANLTPQDGRRARRGAAAVLAGPPLLAVVYKRSGAVVRYLGRPPRHLDRICGHPGDVGVLVHLGAGNVCVCERVVYQEVRTC